MKSARSRPKPRAYHQSGVHALRRALGTDGLPSPETQVGAELARWRAALVHDLGGNPSEAQQTLIDLACRTRVLVDHLDAYLLTLPSIVDKRHRRLWNVAKERTALVNQLQGLLRDLGLERRARQVDVGTAIAAMHGETKE